MSGPDIFFSYAREDQARVAPVVTALEARGWSVFWDRRIPAGQTWRSYIGRALEQARCVVVAWSEHSINSRWVLEEADEGMEREILVPVLLDAVRPPRGFRGIQAADLTGWSSECPSPAFDSFLADLGAVLGAPHPGSPRPLPAGREESSAGLAGPKKAGRWWFGMVLVVGAISVVGYAYLGSRPTPGPSPMGQEAVPTPGVAKTTAPVRPADDDVTNQSNTAAPDELPVGYDFVRNAAKAEWSNGREILTFPGTLRDRTGYAYFHSLPLHPIENGQRVDQFLITHPKWEPSGFIKGRYGPFAIRRDLRIEAETGFSSRDIESDGVTFTIGFEPLEGSEEIKLVSVEEHPDGQTSRLSVDLRPLRNQQGYIVLTTHAGEESDQDWAIWTYAHTVSY